MNKSPHRSSRHVSWIGFILLGFSSFTSARMVALDDGTRLNLECSGSGQPVVIMGAGLGGLSLEWLPVQERLAADTTVCRYDRAGYAESETRHSSRSGEHNADELRQLLEQASLPAPYVLVGHSYAGYVMQIFASRYPQRTAALVLVDASHPQQFRRYEAPGLGIRIAPHSPRSRVRYSRPHLPESLPEDLRTRVFSQLIKPSTRAAMTGEFLHFYQSADEAAEARLPEDLPVVVVSRGKQVWPDTLKGARAEALWTRLQEELAAQTRNGIRLVATGSGHHVHLDQPAVVSDAIRIAARWQQARKHSADWRDRYQRWLTGSQPHRLPAGQVVRHMAIDWPDTEMVNASSPALEHCTLLCPGNEPRRLAPYFRWHDEARHGSQGRRRMMQSDSMADSQQIMLAA